MGNQCINWEQLEIVLYEKYPNVRRPFEEVYGSGRKLSAKIYFLHFIQFLISTTFSKYTKTSE